MLSNLIIQIPNVSQSDWNLVALSGSVAEMVAVANQRSQRNLRQQDPRNKVTDLQHPECRNLNLIQKREPTKMS